MASITKLYLHKFEEGSEKWSRHPRLDEEQAALEASISEDGIIQRHTFRDNHWTTSSVTIQDSQMRLLLKHAFQSQKDFDPELQNWTFTPPFRPLAHCWADLKFHCDAIVDESTREAAMKLKDFLWSILGTSFEVLTKIRETGMVAFDDIWHIFKPGDLMLTTFYGVEAVCRANYCVLGQDDWGGVPHWEVGLEYLNWNGGSCGYDTTHVLVTEFDRNCRVTTLPVYPINFKHDHAGLQKRMIERGRKFESLRGYHFQVCKGTKIQRQAERPVSGRVIIDAHAYYVANNIVKPKLAPLTGAKSQDDTVAGEQDDWGDDYSMADGPDMAVVKTRANPAERAEQLDPLTDSECLLATPWVKGFDFKTKEWAQFCVDDLSPVEWNVSSFSNLIIPSEEKHLAWAFVRNKTRKKSSFDDFIEDKGRGVIILMFGPPGVGKTFTAEAIAERARVPLYAISAGKLGTDPKEVEASLDRALVVCKLWNAMLLLDEADVFLGARSDADLARNELVAVFLTKLEYYPGVCFLTTNRMSSIDPAFQSRVDLLLHYPELTPAVRRRIWQNFINRSGYDKFNLSEADIGQLAEVEMNGREIKNLVKSALLLSTDGERVGMEILDMLVRNRSAALAAFEGEG